MGGTQIYFTNSDGNLGYPQNHLIGVPLDLLTSKNMDTLNSEEKTSQYAAIIIAKLALLRQSLTQCGIQCGA